MHGQLMHGFDLLSSHVHDISLSALAAAVLMLGAVLLLELRTVVQLRHVVDNNLGRIFEQLDLLRFETQQLLEGQQQGGAGAASAAVAAPASSSSPLVIQSAAPAAALVTAPAIPVRMTPGAVYQNAAALAVTGASSHEIAERLGLATGEARLLSSLAQARARRAEAASA